MSRLSREIDFTWASAGDFVFDPNTNDFEDTETLNQRNIMQRVETRLTSRPDDWTYMNSGASANVNTALGKLNNAATRETVANRVRNALMFGGFLQASEFKVRVAPHGADGILVLLQIMIQGQRRAVTQVYSFDLRTRVMHRRA